MLLINYVDQQSLVEFKVQRKLLHDLPDTVYEESKDWGHVISAGPRRPTVAASVLLDWKKDSVKILRKTSDFKARETLKVKLVKKILESEVNIF